MYHLKFKDNLSQFLMKQKSAETLFFPNLNGVRFIAAFFVIIHHIEQFKEKFGFARHFFHLRFVRMIGPLGVFLFFVLSGFLITYLLLEEKHQTKRIAIKSFYVRRILRIWPLYYFVVLLGFFVFPHISWMSVPNETEWLSEDFGQKLLLFLLILPNLIVGVYPDIPFISQSWSIGVEEQFYYFWPWVVAKIDYIALRMKIWWIFLGIFIFFFLLRALGVTLIPKTGGWLYLHAFLHSLRLTCMILGAAAAYLCYYFLDSKLVRTIFSKPVQLFLWVLLLVCLSWEVYLPAINQEFYSVIFALLLMNLAVNNQSIVSLQWPVLEYLGKISYGLYMFHSIGIVIAIKICIYFVRREDIWLTDLVMYGVSIPFTLLVSALSYWLLEKPFLKLKHRFALIKSGKL